MNIIETNLAFNTNMITRKITKRCIFHHSGVTVRQSVEIIHNYHKNTCKYAGIGYHFYIRRDGSIYRGRPENMQGAHAYGANSDSIGVCFEGNLNEEYLTNEQISSGKEMVTYLTEKYGKIEFTEHRKVGNTSCPGKNFKIEEIRNKDESSTFAKKETVSKSIEELAKEVIKGKYGVGEARKQALGSLYPKVQEKVNEILLQNKGEVSKKTTEEIAIEVIQGKWGNGQTRKVKLEQAGYSYEKIQKIVNQKW